MHESFKKLSTLTNLFREARMPEMAEGEPKPEVINFTDEEADPTTVDANRRELLAAGILKPGQKLDTVTFTEDDVIEAKKEGQNVLAQTHNFPEDAIVARPEAERLADPTLAQVANFTDAEAGVIEGRVQPTQVVNFTNEDAGEIVASKPKTPDQSQVASAKKPRK